MNDTPQHTYQILTKRAERLAKVADNLNWTPNIWQGVTVENAKVVTQHIEKLSCPKEQKLELYDGVKEACHKR